jgi:hypothetical protein
MTLHVAASGLSGCVLDDQQQVRAAELRLAAQLAFYGFLKINSMSCARIVALQN